MKRILIIVMTFVMMITMFSCGNQNVKSELIEGTWVFENSALSTQYTMTYEFEDNGEVTVLFKIPLQTASVNFGTYTIESNNEIVITMEDNDPPPYSFYYTNEDGSLRLFDDEEHTKELYHKK